MPTTDPITDPAGFAKLLLDAIHNRNWLLVAMVALIGGVALTRKFATYVAVKGAGAWWGKLAAFFTTDRGGVTLTLLGGVAFSLASVALSGGTVDLQRVLDGVFAGVTAAGGYQMVKRLFWPSGADKVQQNVAEAKAEGQAAGEAAKVMTPEQAAAALDKAVHGDKP